MKRNKFFLIAALLFWAAVGFSQGSDNVLTPFGGGEPFHDTIPVIVVWVTHDAEVVAAAGYEQRWGTVEWVWASFSERKKIKSVDRSRYWVDADDVPILKGKGLKGYPIEILPDFVIMSKRISESHHKMMNR